MLIKEGGIVNNIHISIKLLHGSFDDKFFPTIFYFFFPMPSYRLSRAVLQLVPQESKNGIESGTW